MTQEVGFLISRVTSGFRSSTSGNENSIIYPLSYTIWKLHSYSYCYSISSPCCYSNVALLWLPNSQVYLLSHHRFSFPCKLRLSYLPNFQHLRPPLAFYLVASALNFKKKKSFKFMNQTWIMHRTYCYVFLYILSYLFAAIISWDRYCALLLEVYTSGLFQKNKHPSGQWPYVYPGMNLGIWSVLNK